MAAARDRIDVHLPLRPVEFHILLSLAAGDRHGYGIIQDIEARGEASVPDVGTMYRALARMVESGLIEAVPAAPGADAGEERRNYYRITTRGQRIAEARRLQALTRAARVGGLLAKKAT
jgi:DNA-binding PadR family transcriptional regulator